MTGVPTKVMGKSDAGISNLPLPGLALKLFVDFIDHSHAARPDRVTEAFQSAVGVDRQPALNFKETGFDIIPGPPLEGRSPSLRRSAFR